MRDVRSPLAGAAIGLAAAAVLLGVAALAIHSPDVTIAPTTTAAILGIVTGAGVFAGFVVRPGRFWSGAAAVLTATFLVWGFREPLSNRHILQLVDSAGITPLSVAAAAAGLVALILVTPTRYFRSAHLAARTVATAALATTLVAGSLTYWGLSRYRAGVWQPDSVPAATVAPLPDSLGTVRYRMQPGPGWDGAIHPVSNGFITVTANGIQAYDGPTGMPRWRASNLGQKPVVTITSRGHDDKTGVVVARLDGMVIAFDGSTGNVLWRRQFDGDAKLPAAAGDVHVSHVRGPEFTQPAPADVPTDVDVTTISDTVGTVIDTIAGTLPARTPGGGNPGARDGYVVLHGLFDALVLRDFRRHRSIPIKVPNYSSRTSTLRAVWLQHRLVLTAGSGPMFVVDPAHPDIVGTAPSPCDEGTIIEMTAVAGAVAAVCRRSDYRDVVGSA
mgnify:CR=1 FL=1